MNFSPKAIEKATEELSSLPGIGKRTALRLVLSVLKKNPEEIVRFAEAFRELATHIRRCQVCHSLSDTDVCSICSHPSRDKALLCVVEDIRDVMAIENTGQFNGLYHVLGGIISPMEGIGPDDLQISSLLNRVSSGEIREIILALNGSMEGDTTAFYLYRKMNASGIKITNIARGIAAGDELEFTDEVTLGRSIKNRVPFESSLSLNK